MNYKRVIFTLGTFAIFISAMLVFPVMWALWYGEYQTIPAFGVGIGVGVLGGFAIRRIFRDASRVLYRREGVVIVTGSWLIATFIGAIPFLVSGAIPEVEDAVFETMSGFTTTGSTILTHISDMPRGLLFWRSMTHWLGGMGIIVLFVAVLPALGVGARLLYQFEVPGVEQDELRPRIRETAGLLWKIYLIMTGVETLLLMAVGMDLFDALTHSFGTVATGGFSTHEASVGYFSTPEAGIAVPALVDIIIIFFMFLAGVNFTLYWRATKQGFRVFLKDLEFRTYLTVLLLASLFVTVMLLLQGNEGSAGSAALNGTFQVVSIGTTTGYGTADFDRWPHVVRLFLVFLMFMGGCAGSTGGGMKVFRLMLILRFVGHEIRRFIRPHRVKSMMIGSHPLPDDVIRNTLGFFALAIVVWAIASLIMTAMGLDIVSAVTSVTACLWNIGPGLEAVGPTQNFAEIPVLGKWLLTLLMLLGRLELFTALVLLVPALYRD